MGVIIEEAGGCYSSFAGERTIRGGDMICGNTHVFASLQQIASPTEQEF
jgi:hypothetical protein